MALNDEWTGRDEGKGTEGDQYNLVINPRKLPTLKPVLLLLYIISGQKSLDQRSRPI